MAAEDLKGYKSSQFVRALENPYEKSFNQISIDLKGLKMRGPTRPITQMLEKLGATQIQDARTESTPHSKENDGMVVLWEIMSFKLQELTKAHKYRWLAGLIYQPIFVDNE